LIIFLASCFSGILALKGDADRALFEAESLRRSDEAIRQITGGEGVAEVALSDVTPGRADAWLSITNDSDHPLYDVHLAVVDLVSLSRMQERGASLKDAFLTTTRSLGPLNFGPHQSQLLTNWKVPEGDAISYGISGVARSGAWFQALRYRVVAGQWRRASRVQRGDEVLLDRVDELFPRLESGEPAW